MLHVPRQSNTLARSFGGNFATTVSLAKISVNPQAERAVRDQLSTPVSALPVHRQSTASNWLSPLD